MTITIVSSRLVVFVKSLTFGTKYNNIIKTTFKIYFHLLCLKDTSVKL